MKPNPSLELRPALPEDADGLSALAKRSKAYWGYDTNFMNAAAEALTFSPDEIVSGHFVVAATGGNPIGFYALAWINDTTSELDALFVDSPWIGKGIGKALMCSALRDAKTMGARHLIAQVDPNALPFYLAVGGQRNGEKESESIPGRYLPMVTYALE